MGRAYCETIYNVMKILIPNATDPKNTGDQAMLASLLSLIGNTLPNATIRIHSVNPALQKKLLQGNSVESSLLSWLMFEKPKLFHRFARCLQAAVAVLFPFLISNAKLKSILRDYKKSDCLIFVGNGYLRSTKGLSQSIFLILQLLPFVLAKLSKKPIIVGPMSFGPFAYRWQARLTAKVLSQISPLFIREEISLALAHKYQLTQAILAPDLALLLPHEMTQKTRKNYIGITLRNWYAPRAQRRLEKEVTDSLITFSKNHDVTIKLLVNVNAPEHKDVDMLVATRIYATLYKAGIPVEKPISLDTYQNVMRECQSCDILLGMRMHANILAATQFVPFVGIAYEHKTMGIAKMLGMQSYCLWGHEVTSKKLSSLLQTVFENRTQIQKDLEKTVLNIQNTNEILWKKELSKFL